MSRWGAETGNRMEQLRTALPDIHDPEMRRLAEKLIEGGYANPDRVEGNHSS